MKACALKTHIRDRLQQRKFEIGRLEHSYRQAVNGIVKSSHLIVYSNVLTERKLTTHTESSVKHHEPGILKLAKKYDDYCKQMGDLVRQKQAPQNTVLPPPIDTHGLFALDVDDDIWQDAGLGEEEEAHVPAWLGREDVHDGIKALLNHDCCLEEEECLQKERAAMQLWTQEEWATIQRAHTNHGKNT